MIGTTFLDRMRNGMAAFRQAYAENANDQPAATKLPGFIGLDATCADEAWLWTVRRILDEGIGGDDRTGTGTRAVFGSMVRMPLTRDGADVIPVVSIKKTNHRDAIAELQWMLSGSDSLVPLLKQGIRIWSEWPQAAYNKATGSELTKFEFEKRVMEDADFAAEWGVIDPCYGTQMRRYPTAAGPFDQMSQLIDEIRASPNSRRLIWNLWSPNLTVVKGGTGLPPCHYEGQVSVKNGVLDLIVTMRSFDVGLGWGYNTSQYGWFAHLLARMTGNRPGSLVMASHDTHLYANHIDPISTILDREARPDPTIAWNRTPTSLDDLSMADFVIQGYDPQPFLKLPVAV
jgi:thymidylate synthase